MKVEFISNNNFTIFLNRMYLKEDKVDDKENIEKYFKKLFSSLKDKYSIELNGFLDIDVFINDEYGVILSIQKEDVEYYDYFVNQVDMRVNVVNNAKILYRISDILDIKSLNETDIYYYNDAYFLTKITDYKLYDYVDIVFGDAADKILLKGKKLEYK